jgi:hypothetical protein
VCFSCRIYADVGDQKEAIAMDIELEYNNTLRIQSDARFLSSIQRCEEEMQAFLETHQQEVIPPVLRNLMIRRRTSSEIELAMAGYFDASAQASELYVELLRGIKNIQSYYQLMDSFLASMSGDGTVSTNASAPVALNPFSNTQSNFSQIHEKCSSLLPSIRSSHRKVARKLKVVKAVKKLFTLSKQMTPPETKKTRCSKTGSLIRLQEQLDAAAKGTYVLGMDLNTMSQLVARLSNGIERENDMALCCVERAREGSSVLEMVSELTRSSSSSRRLAGELEEHVCLCLATVHRIRHLVIEEISNSII